MIQFAGHAALQKRLNLQYTIDALADHRVHKRLYEAPGLYQDKRLSLPDGSRTSSYNICHALPSLPIYKRRGMWVHPSAFSLSAQRGASTISCHNFCVSHILSGGVCRC